MAEPQANVRRLTGEGLIVEGDAPIVAHLRLRGADRACLGDVGAALGVALPETPNRATFGDGVAACWLGPQEWALIGAPAADVAERAATTCAGRALHHVADAGQAWRRWRLSGARAGDLLAAGCALDLHPRAFEEGACARTLLGQVNILLVREHGAWAVFAERALADFVWGWFARAGRQWRLREAG